ncbi:Bet_v_1 domain-containing protein, partial [Psidium guajava]
GTKETLKEKVEFDDENKRVIHVGVEGDVFDYYKCYSATWEAIARGGGPAIAKMIIEYEKLGESMPHPVNYLDFMANITKDIDAHLV